MEALQARALAKGGSISSEVRRAVREYLSRTSAQPQDAQAAPVLHGWLQEQFDQLEAWLRPMLAGTHINATTQINATTTMLLAMEILCGTQADPLKARETLDIMRGRVYKVLRRREQEDTGGAT